MSPLHPSAKITTAAVASLKKKKSRPTSSSFSSSFSLTELCRNVIIQNLERYPMEAFGILDEEEFQSLLLLRHRRTQPKDGSERLVPAVSDKFLSALEAANPQFFPANHNNMKNNNTDNNAKLIDETLWKTCVEYRFRRGGMTRPLALELPWPFLVQRLQEAANRLLLPLSVPQHPHSSSSFVTTTDADLANAIHTLETTPMNVALLRDSGVGKTMKKITKKQNHHLPIETLRSIQTILNNWMELVNNNDDDNTNDHADEPCAGKTSKSKTTDHHHHHSDEQQEDLRSAESCQTWRQLFAVLKQREEDRRNSQGQRMRDIRKNLQDTRPRLVKVRPATTAKQQRFLDRSATTSSAGSNKIDKMSQIRKEAALQQAMRKPPPRPHNNNIQDKSPTKNASTMGAPSFGAAVAFCAGTKQGAAHRKRKIGGTLHHLGGGKQMKIPDQKSKGPFVPRFKMK